MKGPFSLDPFDPEINQQEASKYCAGNPRSLLLEVGLMGSARERSVGQGEGATLCLRSETRSFAKRLVYDSRTHIAAEIAASRHPAHRCLNGLAAEMLVLGAGQRDASMPRLTGFSVFDD
jgi:hypothetical protein